MKEFTKTIEKELSGGLRPFGNSRVSTGLKDLKNAKPSESGLEAFEDLSKPVSGVSFNWPFPQLFVGSQHRILADEGTIYSLDSSWNKTEQLSGLTGGTSWDFVDFGAFFLLTNGQVMVYLNHGTVDTPVSPAVYANMTDSATLPRCGTFCNFKGQLVGGNVKTSWYGCGTNSVIWSDIGSIVMTPKPNRAGVRVDMPWEGTVQKVKRLGDSVMVYGSNGILAMIADSEHMWKWQERATFGLPNKDAVGGDIDEHIFVDQFGTVYRATFQKGIEELGYKEFFKDLSLSSLVVSYDKGKKEYYISDGSKCFLLNSYGLCEVHQIPTSVCSVGGTSYGMYKSDRDKEFRLELDGYDFGIRAIKTLTTMEVGGHCDDEFQVSVDWKSDQATNVFNESDWKMVSPTGFVFPQVSATDFRLKVRAETYNNLSLEYLIARLRLVDRRAHRGKVEL